MEECPPDAWTLEMLEALDLTQLSDRDLVRVVLLTQKLVAHTQAIGLRAAAQLSSEEGPDDWAQDELAAAMGVGSVTGSKFLTTARALSGRLRRTGQLLAAGLITPRKAEMLAVKTELLDDRAAAEVEHAVLPDAAGQTPHGFEDAVKAAVIRADPEGATRRARDAKALADVRLRPAEDAMSQLVIDLPAAEGLAAWNLIDGLAGPGHPDDPRLAGERRVDAFINLIDARYAQGNLPTRHGKPIGVGITMSLGTALGASDQPAHLHGYGPIPAAIARELATQGTWRAWILDATTAHLRALGTKTYRPDQATRDHIQARDGTCTFPYCDVASSRCDIDHAIPWHQGGTTDPDNCGPESRRHHRAKHGRWQLTRHPDGTCTWTSPLGFTYTNTPTRHPIDPE